MESFQARWNSGEFALMRLPVCGSSSVRKIPRQYEPNASHSRPSASSIALGSMALNGLPLVDVMTGPPSVHK